MLTCAPLCLLAGFWLLPISSQKVSGSLQPRESSNQTIPLSMMENAVDDMYDGCMPKMEEMVREKYFKEETRPNSTFAKAWKKAESCAEKNHKDKKNDTDVALTKNHMQAICVYTGGHSRIYDVFNEAVRTNRTIYGTSFPFHSLHFWLTSAIQILNNNTCHVTYRRTNVTFTGSVNQTIRFGTFASSSLLTNLTRFGHETCFKIKTCLGAYLKDYPSLKKYEQEVLIPPYETFIITGKTKRPVGSLKCRVVYFLEGVGWQSNLNCSATGNSGHSRLAV
ncbi:ecto-ADP-ribosyltransferase 4-like [Mugil cephalus]|uniref:ecto-ADP-ribosyltransferase 4-like n=1 Tax=Mugil cephalus TaxID=48193 RepID=UPI001FB59437|nr:ecto-ADP-ribosyltransferase 4-like [Mugil cephalus]